MAIRTDESKCNGCLRCIAVCPFHALKVRDRLIIPDEELCSLCGLCISECPQGALYAEESEDIEHVVEILKSGERVGLILDPSVRVLVENVQSMISFLGALDNVVITDTSLGAEVYAYMVASYYLRLGAGPLISSACPAGVYLVRSLFPKLVDRLVPLLPPAAISARLLKIREKVRFAIYIGPCMPLKKGIKEIKDYPLDVVITDGGLRDLAKRLGFNGERVLNTKACKPSGSGLGRLHVVPGGLSELVSLFYKGKWFSYPDEADIAPPGRRLKDYLAELERELATGSYGLPKFVEILLRPGGCLGKIGTSNRIKSLKRFKSIVRETSEDLSKIEGEVRDLSAAYGKLFEVRHLPQEHPAILLDKEGIESFVRELYRETGVRDCGLCGYGDCETFARLVLAGLAPRDLCVQLWRKAYRGSSKSSH